MLKKISLSIVIIFVFSIFTNAQNCEQIKRDNLRLIKVIKAYDITNKEAKKQSIVFESELELANEQIQLNNSIQQKIIIENETLKQDVKKQKFISKIFGGSSSILLIVVFVVLI